MKRLILMLALIFATAAPALAQVQGGNISGTAKDEQGGVLPGAEVTVQGVDRTTTTHTNGAGQFNFVDLAPGSYKVTVQLSGFASVVKDVIVSVGRTAPADVSLRIAIRPESITVTAPAPIVDPKITGTAINFTKTELDKIPTSRDPFALLRTVPGVLLDQVNVGGNETGQQALVVGKGARQQDTSWTLDGVEITDMAAPGQSPTYFNFDSFDEIQVSTAGSDIRSRTGGATINMITKRGSNVFHGGIRSYFQNNSLEGVNIPVELQTISTTNTTIITPGLADHTLQSYDYGVDLGGPILKDKAWFYASMSKQDIRIMRRNVNTPLAPTYDRTSLQNPQVKVNWQATRKDNVSFLFLNGFKIKDGRAVGATTSETYEATLHQDNAYSDSPFHGLWKIGDDRVITSNILLSAKYAYYNTGIKLTPEGGMDAQAGRNLNTPTSAYGSTSQNLAIRPQHSVTGDVNHFVRLLGQSHNLKYGAGYRRVTNQVQVEFPGNGILAIEQTGATPGTSNRAQVFRQSNGVNLIKYADVYLGDSVSLNRMTIDAAVRYDRQWGDALPSTTAASKGLPTVIPAVNFPGYKSLFTWNNFSPRFGLSYMLDATGKTVARASYSRFAGQLAASTVGLRNPATGATPGNATYPWTDLNGDHYAQANEVDTTGTPIATGGGFSTTDPINLPLSTTSFVDANLRAPITQSVVVGVERELMPSMAVMLNYTYNRTSNLFGNMTSNLTPRVGFPSNTFQLAGTSPLTGTLPDGSLYSIPIYTTPTGATNAAGFTTQTVPGYTIDYHGVELNLIKRLSNRWMGRITLGYNDARENYSDPNGVYNSNGNPTPRPTEPLANGGQYVPTSSLTTGIFMNSKWQVNANGMYQAPYGVEIAANVFGRQGYPFVLYRSGVALGLDTNQNVLVAPVDTYRLGNVWLTDLRIARPFRFQTSGQTIEMRLMADAFNLFNTNTELARNGAVNSTTYGQLFKSVNPRVVRLGLTIGF